MYTIVIIILFITGKIFTKYVYNIRAMYKWSTLIIIILILIIIIIIIIMITIKSTFTKAIKMVLFSGLVFVMFHADFAYWYYTGFAISFIPLIFYLGGYPVGLFILEFFNRNIYIILKKHYQRKNHCDKMYCNIGSRYIISKILRMHDISIEHT